MLQTWPYAADICISFRLAHMGHTIVHATDMAICYIHVLMLSHNCYFDTVFNSSEQTDLFSTLVM